MRTLYVREPGRPAVDVPFVTIFRKGGALVVLVKGTQTRDEWMYGEWVFYWARCVGIGDGLSGHERLGVTVTASNLQCFFIATAVTADFRYQQHVSGNTANSGHKSSSGENSVGVNQEAAFAFPGGTHAGFTSLADALWRGGMHALLDGNVKRDVTHISVAGHSLGAGVATLLSYRMQVRPAGAHRVKHVRG